MIDQINFRLRVSDNGKPFSQAVLWVAGVPFTADLDERTERVICALARKIGQEVTDFRGLK